MTRISFLLCVAAVSSQSACSFVVVHGAASTRVASSSWLGYANGEAATGVETTHSKRQLDSSALGGLVSQEAAFSKLLTAQVAREFSMARRYLLAASVVKEMSDHFFVAEEEQRIKAMQVMEYARTHGIALADYQSQIQTTPIDSAVSPVEFLRELMSQEDQDMQLLDKAMASLSLTSSPIRYP